MIQEAKNKKQINKSFEVPRNKLFGNFKIQKLNNQYLQRKKKEGAECQNKKYNIINELYEFEENYKICLLKKLMEILHKNHNLEHKNVNSIIESPSFHLPKIPKHDSNSRKDKLLEGSKRTISNAVERELSKFTKLENTFGKQKIKQENLPYPFLNKKRKNHINRLNFDIEYENR